MRPRVSVLIPTYNRPAFLAEAIASVQAQTYPAEQVELVVEHDGQDGPPRGLAATINRAFARATGEMVTVLADDDLVYPGKLELLVAALEAHFEADAAYALGCRVTADGQPGGVSYANRRYLHAHPVVTWEHVLAGHGLRIHGTALVYRRAAWERAGPWDETLPTAEEWEFHLRLLSQGARFVAVDAITDMYRIHAGQKSSRPHRRTTRRLAALARINAKYFSPEASHGAA